MSPFSQLVSAAGSGFKGSIDRDFSPILNYLDEFDRHFSRRHHFINCFIPRFDLEEDRCNYYLYGDIPGADVNDINVEAYDNHTLVIWGKTAPVAGSGLQNRGEARAERPESGSSEGDFVKVDVEDREHESHGARAEGAHNAPHYHEDIPVQQTNNQAPVQGQKQEREQDEDAPATAFVSTVGASHSRSPRGSPSPETERNHHQQFNAPASHNDGHYHNSNQQRPHITQGHPASHIEADHRVLLSERLGGDFHRTFAFPSAVREEGVQASMENGVLSLVVPKRQLEGKRERGRRIPVLRGKSWNDGDRERRHEGGDNTS